MARQVAAGIHCPVGGEAMTVGGGIVIAGLILAIGIAFAGFCVGAGLDALAGAIRAVKP